MAYAHGLHLCNAGSQNELLAPDTTCCGASALWGRNPQVVIMVQVEPGHRATLIGRLCCMVWPAPRWPGPRLLLIALIAFLSSYSLIRIAIRASLLKAMRHLSVYEDRMLPQDWEERSLRVRAFLDSVERDCGRGVQADGSPDSSRDLNDPQLASLPQRIEGFWESYVAGNRLEIDIGSTDRGAGACSYRPTYDAESCHLMDSLKRISDDLCLRGDVETALRVCRAMYLLSALYSEGELTSKGLDFGLLQTAGCFDAGASVALQRILSCCAATSEDSLARTADLVRETRMRRSVPIWLLAHCHRITKYGRQVPYCLSALLEFYVDRRLSLLMKVPFTGAMADLESLKLVTFTDSVLGTAGGDAYWEEVFAEVERYKVGAREWPLRRQEAFLLDQVIRSEVRTQVDSVVEEAALRFMAALVEDQGHRQVEDVYSGLLPSLPKDPMSGRPVRFERVSNAKAPGGYFVARGLRFYAPLEDERWLGQGLRGIFVALPDWAP